MCWFSLALFIHFYRLDFVFYKAEDMLYMCIFCSLVDTNGSLSYLFFMLILIAYSLGKLWTKFGLCISKYKEVDVFSESKYGKVQVLEKKQQKWFVQRYNIMNLVQFIFFAELTASLLENTQYVIFLNTAYTTIRNMQNTAPIKATTSSNASWYQGITLETGRRWAAPLCLNTYSTQNTMESEADTGLSL